MTHSVHVALAAHPANPERFHERIDVTLTQGPDGALTVLYAVRGLNIDLHVPTPHAPAPAGALWKTTCCELFVGPVGRSDYREFNFSPSGQWAVYDFLDYRAPKPGVPACPGPGIETRRTEDLLQVEAKLPPGALPGTGGHPLRIALSAVLETQDSHLGYWALGHAPGKPDFHRAGFMLSVGAAGIRPGRFS